MNWQKLTTLEQLQQIKEESFRNSVLIFKHSTRCSTSHMMLDRFERGWDPDQTVSMKPYFLDLINHRELSNTIASTFQVEHESPQILLIQKGIAVLDLSHFQIDLRRIVDFVKSQSQQPV